MIHPLKTLRAYRRLKRYREVVFTLVKYGFGDIADRIGVGVSSWRFLSRWKKSKQDTPTPERLRLALGDLGPTFTKFGQLLSTRPDILPELYIRELERLQDRVKPFAFIEVERIFREELEGEPQDLFLEFEPVPIASGSIAQVHRARTSDGKAVAVKIQRPGIHRVIATDLDILKEITAMVERHVPELRWFRPSDLVDQFATTIRRELDFISEAQAMQRFRRNFSDDPTRFVPAVYWDLTTSRVLTTDYVEGVKVTHVEELQRRGLSRKEVARNGARSILKEVFVFRHFHADPHPGNFFVLEDNVIAAIDFGIVGRLDDETAEQLGLLLSSVIRKDVEGVIRVFRDLDLLGEVADPTLLRFDVDEFIDRYHGLSLQKIDAEDVIGDLLQIIRRHQIVLPVNLALLGRMLAVSAGVGRMLDPDFDIVEEAKPFIRSFMAERIDPRKKLRELRRTWSDYQNAFQAFPADLEVILAKIKQGEMLVSLHHEGLNRFILEMDRSSNRVAFALVIASLVVGSSLVMQLEKGPVLFGFPAIGLAGYLIAAILGLWLVLAILRSGRI